MPEKYYGLVEMAFSFGVVLSLAVWQLVSLEAAKKRTREKLGREASTGEPGPGSG